MHASADVCQRSAAAESVADVVAAIDRLPSSAIAMSFRRGAAQLPRGGHSQGIQLRFDPRSRRTYAYLSHDSQTVAYLAIVEFPADLSDEGKLVHVHLFPSDGRSPPLRHAGGIQLAGDVLAVGLEDNQDKTRSEAQFWQIAEPTQPVALPHLTIRRAGAAKDQTAGGVGLVEHKGRHLLAVANWDSRAIDFYRSNGRPLADESCRFEPLGRWLSDTADKTQWRPDATCGPYQAVNLLEGAHQALFLVGTYTSATGEEIADVFTIDLQADASKLFRKVTQKKLALARANHLRDAGGLWIHDGKLAILSSAHDLAEISWINLIR